MRAFAADSQLAHLARLPLTLFFDLLDDGVM